MLSLRSKEGLNTDLNLQDKPKQGSPPDQKQDKHQSLRGKTQPPTPPKSTTFWDDPGYTAQTVESALGPSSWLSEEFALSFQNPILVCITITTRT